MLGYRRPSLRDIEVVLQAKEGIRGGWRGVSLRSMSQQRPVIVDLTTLSSSLCFLRRSP